MSLRWIHENLEAPTCDEECSDIDDSCSDDSYDTDLSINEDEKGTIEIENGINGGHRKKRETRRHPTTTVTFDENGTSHYIASETAKLPPCVIWDPRIPAENPIYNCLVIKLFCRTGYHVAITASGGVRGLSGANEQHALLHIKPVSFGVIRIQSEKTGLYLAFNKKGRLYGEVRSSTSCTLTDNVGFSFCDSAETQEPPNAAWRNRMFPLCKGRVAFAAVNLKRRKQVHILALLIHSFQPNVSKENTEWEQWNIGSYDAFRSRKYSNQGWWIGIKKNGRAKPGPRTRWGQKAVQFLALRQE